MFLNLEIVLLQASTTTSLLSIPQLEIEIIGELCQALASLFQR